MGKLTALLERIEAKGIEGGLFHYTTLGSLSKSSCRDSTLTVLDYDLCKDAFCRARKLSDYKSCDALKIMLNDDRLDFIEMKSIEKVIEYNKEPNVSHVADRTVTRFSLVDKIMDSFILWSQIIRAQELQVSGNEINELYDATYNYYVVVDTSIENDSIVNLTLTMTYLSEASNNLRQELIDKIGAKLSGLTRYQNLSAKLISCADFHKIYVS